MTSWSLEVVFHINLCPILFIEDPRHYDNVLLIYVNFITYIKIYLYNNTNYSDEHGNTLSYYNKFENVGSRWENGNE